MKDIRIISSEDMLFDEAWRIYNDNFPYEEKRELWFQKIALTNPIYHFIAFESKGKVMGILGYWNFKSYVYIEHFAIDKSLQGGGHGTKILDWLKDKYDKYIILEIEPVDDEQKQRRLIFYLRSGMIVNSFPHNMFAYHEKSEGLPFVYPLVLLSYPDAMNRELYDTFEDNLQKIVMAGNKDL